MEGRLMKLKERFLDENDPSLFIRKYIDTVRKLVSELESAYRDSSTNRNRIVMDALIRVRKIGLATEETEELLSDHATGLMPPEDSNQSLDPEAKSNLGEAKDVKDMILWGPNGYAYIAGDVDSEGNEGTVSIWHGYNTWSDTIRKLRAGDPDAEVLLQIGNNVHPVRSISSKDKKDIVVHFEKKKENPKKLREFPARLVK